MKYLILFVLLFHTIPLFSQTPNLHWKYQNDGKSYVEDRGACIAFDPSGNVVVAGYVENGCTQNDISVIKYSPLGDTLWVLTYDGSGTYGDDDYPRALAIDAAGFIYVAGTTENNGFEYAVTIKINTNGNIIWANRYLSAVSAGNDVVVDGSGNVYMCGYRELSNNKDFLLVKYNSSGTQQWVQNYSNGNYDEAVAIKTDITGNIYVTGKQSGVNLLFDWATLKYDPSGSQQWLDVFSNPAPSYSEVPVDLVIDISGFIYVAGYAPLASTSNRDYYVIKYDVNGNRIWETSYNNIAANSDDYPVAMAVDGAGSVYVSGNSVGSGTGQDICTVKFNSSGQFVWAARIDSIMQADYARDVVVDPTGNFVYVAGDITVPPLGAYNRDWIMTKLDTSGNEIARHIQNGPGNSFDLPFDLVVNGTTGVLATTGMLAMNFTGNGNGDIATLLFDPQLTPLWTRFNNGDSFTNDQGVDMVVDKAGNSYVCGFTIGDDLTYEDLVVFKVNASGQRLWEYIYQGNEESSSEIPVAITIDAQKNVYVTGTTDTSTGVNYRNIYTVKLDPSGNVLWEQIYNGTAGGADNPVAISVSASGKVYIGATTVNTGTGFDGTVLCYDNSGNLLWSTSFDKGGLAEIFKAMAVDNQDNVYAAGLFNPPSGAFSDGLLVKFDASGTVLWDTIYDFSTANNDRDFFNSIALDASGNVFVAGQSNFDFVTAKYTPSGIPEWIQNYSYSNYKDSACVIAVDSNNDILVGGIFGQTINSDFGVVKYRNDGTQVWDRRYANSAGSDDILNDIALDDDDNIFLTGWEIQSFSTNYNFMTLKYDSSGTFIYELIWSDSLGIAPDYGKRVGLDSLGNIYVMGDANENCLGNVFVNGFRWNTQVVRYGQGIFTDEGVEHLDPENISIFPNPANNQFNLLLPESFFGKTIVELNFYDVNGKAIFTTSEQSGEELTINCKNWPSGIIFYTASTNLLIKTGKVIIAK